MLRPGAWAIRGAALGPGIGGDVPIQIRMTGPGAEHKLGSLLACPRADADLRRHARMSLVPAEPGPGDMGAAFEVIQLVVDSGFQTLSLALAYATWRTSRPARHQLTITIERDGSTITLDEAEPDTVDAIIRALE